VLLAKERRIVTQKVRFVRLLIRTGPLNRKGYKQQQHTDNDGGKCNFTPEVVSCQRPILLLELPVFFFPTIAPLWPQGDFNK